MIPAKVPLGRGIFLPQARIGRGFGEFQPIPVFSHLYMQEKFHHYNPKLKKFANKHRNGSTKAEVRLWCELFRNKQMLGFSFMRQRPIGFYIADFFCKELNLVIETDGSTHFSKEAQLADLERTNWLEAQGYTVIRFWDDEVMKNIDGVRDKITCWIRENHKDKLPE